jgi:hypothetical protein
VELEFEARTGTADRVTEPIFGNPGPEELLELQAEIKRIPKRLHFDFAFIILTPS